MNIWTITDGKIGDRVQCAGLARALGGEVDEKVVKPGAFYAALAPLGPMDPAEAPHATGSAFAPPFPDVVVASGRRAIPYARAIKKASGGASFVILLKDPRVRADFADLIWAPVHDNRTGANVMTTLTSPHGLGDKIAAGAASPGSAIAGLAKPLLGVVLGGPSGGARYDEDAARGLAIRIAKARCDFAAVAVTPSRRTPGAFMAAFKEGLSGPDVFIWDGEGENPYADILRVSASLIVAADSHNMMSEACASGAGVYAWRPAGMATKLDRFVSALEETGRVRGFETSAAPFEAAPLDATAEIAAEAVRRMGVSDTPAHPREIEDPAASAAPSSGFPFSRE